MTIQVVFDDNTCTLTQLDTANFSVNTTEPCVNEETTKTTTTLEMVMDVNGVQTITDQRQIECNREFSVQTAADLNDGVKLINQLRADLATITLLSRECLMH